MFWDLSTTHSRHFSYHYMHFNAKFHTNSPLIFGQSRPSHIGLKKIKSIWSQALGPIKRPLTASNQPKHGKTLKNGNKTQVGRKSYLLEFVKTNKSGSYALSSPSRTTSLLAPSKSNGPIARDLREKHPLSLKPSQTKPVTGSKMPPHVFVFD